ncbi:21 kDa seed protein-like [Durio zibethinus]|uniref:21 kDa seed protein-like n=1 Tax=Durio zibethinus TaxID=66656 RepID=A0A6P5YB43_DURZI|nr:21 kDa seed protein-like [Durio zibethinus]
MKTIAAAVLLLFFVFSTKSCFLGVANAANEPVFDTDGDELRTGVEYYVVSSIRGAGGGGLDLGSSPNQICPKFVVQRGLDMEFGRPVVFYPVDANDSVVHQSTDVNIVFLPSIDPYCRTTTMWKLDNYDHSSGKWWLTTGGIRGDPGPQTLTSWFKIEKFRPDFTDRVYRLIFCPSVCDSCVTLCNDISRYDCGTQLRLGLTTPEAGWPFSFVKASKDIQQVVGKQSR